MWTENRSLQTVSSDVVKATSGEAVRMVYRLHDERSPTPSKHFQQTATNPRLRPAQQVLGDQDLYIFLRSAK